MANMTIDWGIIGNPENYEPQSPKPKPEPVDLEFLLSETRRLLGEDPLSEVIMMGPEVAALLAEIDRLRQDAEAARYYNAVTT